MCIEVKITCSFNKNTPPREEVNPIRGTQIKTKKKTLSICF